MSHQKKYILADDSDEATDRFTEEFGHNAYLFAYQAIWTKPEEFLSWDEYHMTEMANCPIYFANDAELLALREKFNHCLSEMIPAILYRMADLEQAYMKNPASKDPAYRLL